MIKRAFLIAITVLVVIRLLLGLLESFNQPQVQSRLQMYQSELILQASAYKAEENLAKTRDSFLGEDVYNNVQKEYEAALEETQKNYALLEQQKEVLPSPEVLNKLEQLTDDINLKIGILQAEQGEVETAVATWQKLDDNETAKILTSLWQSAPLPPNTETQLQESLSGWFEYKSLDKLYQQTDNQTALTNLEEREQSQAEKALLKLLLIGLTPFVGVIGGICLLIVLLIQWVQKGKNAILSDESGYQWQVPWGGEVIWQVIIVGFFFVSQYILPLIFSWSGFNPSNYSIEIKAVYVLVSYLSMAVIGLVILYFSVRPFRPFADKNWFSFKLWDNWLIWGIGGYLVAFPLVLLVSLINQQLWRGQGGSNPLILLALESKSLSALLIFFVTAAIAAPIFEEIIFRGFLLASLTRYLGSWGAILLSGLVFAAAHLSLSEVLPLTVLGIILGFVYNRSRNLLSCILLHSLWNGGTLMSLFILGS